MDYLCTQGDFDKARSMLLKYFKDNTVATRRQLTLFKNWGLSYEAIELAVRDLLRSGTIEELYVLPSTKWPRGQRPVYYGWTLALDTEGTAALPEGVVRTEAALALVAGKELV